MKMKAPALIFIFIGVTGIIVLMLIKIHNAEENTDEYYMPSNSCRVEFLNSYGLIVKPDPVQQDIIIPEKFGEIYASYNELQISQGFDLTEYKGRRAVMYSYDVLNCADHTENVTADLIVCDGKLIACDISLNEENGELWAIIK